MPRTLIVLAFLLLPSCSAVDREFRAPLTLEAQCARRPASGETGVLIYPTPLWPTLDALRASNLPNQPQPPHVEGPFEVLQSIPDPAWFAYQDFEIASVQLRILSGPHAAATGWLTSMGPLLIPAYPDPAAAFAPSSTPPP
jgi:hypothetical protein